jgi:hypothetical protein
MIDDCLTCILCMSPTHTHKTTITALNTHIRWHDQTKPNHPSLHRFRAHHTYSVPHHTTWDDHSNQVLACRYRTNTTTPRQYTLYSKRAEACPFNIPAFLPLLSLFSLTSPNEQYLVTESSPRDHTCERHKLNRHTRSVRNEPKRGGALSRSQTT